MIATTDRLADVLSSLSREDMREATYDRLGGSRVAALRLFLWEYAGGLCVVCGLPTRLDANRRDADYAEVGHLISASTYAPSNLRCGFVPGNCALQCHTCNADASMIDHSFTADEIISDLVPTEWPTLRKVSRASCDQSSERREARRTRGVTF